MAKAEASVQELVDMIQRGEIRLPEMQRRYVWRSTRVRDLLDSLYRGYPSGAILLWETDEAVPLQELAIQQERNPYHSTRLLLDGQQRLTSLSAVIRGEPIKVRNKRRPIEILFNLEHPDDLQLVTEVEENADDEDDPLTLDEADSSEDELQRRFDKMTFVVANKKLEQMPHWIKVSEVFKSTGDAQFLKRAGVSGFEDNRYERYTKRLERLRAIRGYMYRMDILERALKYNEVTEIFVRVNSLGAKLRSSDLALAQITAKWRNSLSTFQEFQTKCAETGFDLDLSLFLKSLMAFATEQSRFLVLGSLSITKLQDAWKKSCEGMEFALNFVKSNVGIDSPVLLSSPFILVTLAFFGSKRGYEISAEEAAQLRYWTLVANAKGRYSRGSSETILDQDLATLRQGGPAELLDRLRLQVGRLDIVPEELEGRNQRSALFKTMFMSFRAANAKDWRSNLTISMDQLGAQHKLQFHHFFPKAVLAKNGYSLRDADDISNLTFIGGKTNRAISDKSPSDYIAPYLAKSGEVAFTAQCIPIQEDLLRVENYRAFLVRRRSEVARRLNSFLVGEEFKRAETAVEASSKVEAGFPV